MSREHAETLSRALVRLLRPLVRVLLRHGVSHRVFSDLARQVYVTVAEEEFTVPGRKQTTARIAVLTGLHRKEVARLRQQPPEVLDAMDERYNRAARVAAGWLRDPDFQDAAGAPAALAHEDPGGFEALVRRYSGDMPARAVLDELVRAGAVIREDDGRVRLLRHGYVPAADEAAKLQILGTDTRDLLATIGHNLEHDAAEARFQRKVSYDNVPEEHAAAFRALAAERGQALLEELDAWLAARDRDRTPAAGGTGRVRLGLGIYHIEDRPERAEADSGPRGSEE